MAHRYRFIFFFLFFTTVLFADETDIDDLLNTIAVKTDLSEKTKLANGGISYVYTRSDLDRMQAHTLQDVLQSSYPFGYNENYYGLPDPYGMQPFLPNKSSTIKIYVDNQEITTGLYGSGMIIYGDMDIDFVDHIEIYSGNPTFEYSTEPAFTIIKLYTKVAQKDEGTKLSFSLATRGSSNIYGYNTQELDNAWSYFAYVNHTNQDKKSYNNYNATLSKDKKQTHIVATFYNKHHHFLVDAYTAKRDAFASQSIFLTPEISKIDTNYMHIGYDGEYKNFNFLLECDIHNTTSDFLDKNAQLIQQINQQTASNLTYMTQTDSDSQTYTAGVKHTFHFKDNTLLTGVKYRLKHFQYDTLIFNDVELPHLGHTEQKTTSVFVEDQYNIANNKIVTLGLNYSKVTNNHSVQNDDLYGARVGYTYTSEHLTSKTIYSHLELSLDPYLVNSIYLEDITKKMPVTKHDVFIQNLIYKKLQHTLEFIGSFIFAKNQLYINTDGKLKSSDKMNIESFLLRYKYEYRKIDSIELSFAYNYIDELPLQKISINNKRFVVRSFNTTNKFDIFNELIYSRNSLSKENFFNYSAGIMYHMNENVTVALKGMNIFNDAKKTNYVRLNPQTLQMDEPLSVSPAEQLFLVTLELVF